MKLHEAYPSVFLKAEDITDREVTYIIDSVDLEEFGQGRDKEKKQILTLDGEEKRLILNRTNAKTIGKLHGEETDTWPGKTIILTTREIEYQGNVAPAIRVSGRVPQPKPPENTGRARARADQPPWHSGR